MQETGGKRVEGRTGALQPPAPTRRPTARRTPSMLHAVESWTLVSILGIAGTTFAFLVLADKVFDGGTHRFDTWLLLSLRNPADHSDPLGPDWFEGMMRDFTALGATAVLVLLTLAAVGYLSIVGKRHAAIAAGAASFSGIAVNHLLKWGFDRPRPDLVPHETLVLTSSFPSGHAMLSAVVYLTLGAMLARTESSHRVKVYLFALAATLTFLVGTSRVYLGVHWPTDVLAGWALGAGWALSWQLVMSRLQRSGRIEPPTGPRE